MNVIGTNVIAVKSFWMLYKLDGIRINATEANVMIESHFGRFLK
jgi:hypothetical protein